MSTALADYEEDEKRRPGLHAIRQELHSKHPRWSEDRLAARAKQLWHDRFNDDGTPKKFIDRR